MPRRQQPPTTQPQYRPAAASERTVGRLGAALVAVTAVAAVVYQRSGSAWPVGAALLAAVAGLVLERIAMRQDPEGRR